jgi:hypothetical protein
MPAGKLILLLGWHLTLTGLPPIAAALFAARCGLRSVPVLLAIALAASGVVAMLSFWTYYAEPFVGETYAYFVFLGSVGLTAWCLWGRRIDPGLLRELATPLALWVLGTVFLTFFGFLHGGADAPLGTAITRFSHPLPSDNDIPLFYSDWFFHHGHSGTPPVFPGEWLSSDRPPLQIGYVLSQRIFGWDESGLHYQVLGVVLQQLWIVGLWALLLAARVGRMTRALAMMTVLVSDLVIVNGFFVWPKLLPAAMLLAAAAILITPLWSELRRSPWAAALVAALFGLAMLGHGSSLFGLIALAAIAAVRGLPSWRWLAVGALVGLALLAPWSAYQKYGDPPGNRLTKWMLAGVEQIDDRGPTEAIVDSYREAGLGGTVQNKLDNFAATTGESMFADNVEEVVDGIGEGDLERSIRSLRLIFFFYLVPSMGLLLLGPLAMGGAWRRRADLDRWEWTLALTCFAAFVIGAIGWGLILFGPPAAKPSIHIGSYLLPILGLCGCVVGLRTALPRFATYFVAVNALLMLALYAPSLDPPADTGYSLVAAMLAALALAGFAAVTLQLDWARPLPVIGRRKRGRPHDDAQTQGAGEHPDQRHRVDERVTLRD